MELVLLFESADDAPPFQFNNVYRESKGDKVNLDHINNLTGKSFDIYPQVDDLLFFPSHMRHGVPESRSNEERIMIERKRDNKIIFLSSL